MKCTKCNTKKEMFLTNGIFGTKIKKMYVCSSCGASIPLGDNE